MACPRGKWLSVAVIPVLAGLSAAVAWHLFEDPSTIRDRLASAQTGLFIWRMACIALIVGLWPWWVALFARRATPELRRKLVSYRWRLLAWLVILEMVLAQNIAGLFIEALFA